MSKKTKSNQRPKPQIAPIISLEALDARTCEVIKLRADRAAKVAEMEAKVAAIQAEYADSIGSIDDDIVARETAVQSYCRANRAALFVDKKSRETLTAVIGFEWTPYRVETTGRKITWKIVVSTLEKLVWGANYLRNPEAQVDKDKLLADREKLKPEQLAEAGISFERDDQFFLRGKEVA